MQREVKKYLFDIYQACESLLEFVKGKSLDDYNTNELLRAATERKLEIIGEALNKALKLEPSLENHISNVRRIIGLRNKLIHGYESIANDVIWGILDNNVPILFKDVQSLLNHS